ncbi:MAG: hypothetical protein ACR2IR_04495 [Acidimicrobiia bacterium]
MPDSPKPPEYLVDRSLGKRVVPQALRGAGRIVHTLAEVFGSREESVTDEEWIARAGAEGWVVLTKDKRIRTKQAEREVVRRHRVRLFCVTKGGLTGDDQAQRLVDNLARIERVARRPGPYIYAVHERRLEQLWSPPRKRTGRGRRRRR